MPLKLLIDENLRSESLRSALHAHQQHGQYPVDIVRVGDAGCPPLGSRDETILAWASAEGRVLVSKDLSTLQGPLLRLLSAGVNSPGIILLRPGLTMAEILDLLVVISYATEATEWENTVRWMP